MTVDLKDHFLRSPMKNPQYMKMKWSLIPNDIRDFYNLHSKVTNNGYVFIRI